MKIRSANPADAVQIADLNDVFVSVTSPMDAQRFLELFELCSYCLVVHDGEGVPLLPPSQLRRLQVVLLQRNEMGHGERFSTFCLLRGLVCVRSRRTS